MNQDPEEDPLAGARAAAWLILFAVIGLVIVAALII